MERAREEQDVFMRYLFPSHPVPRLAGRQRSTKLDDIL
jgi:hypothetical protein